MRRRLRSNYVERTRCHQAESDFSIEKYGERTEEKEECDEQLLAEYASLMAFYLASVGEVEEESRGHGIQRGIGNLISCPYCPGPWCAAALALSFVFSPKMTRLFAAILASVAMSDFLHRAYHVAKEGELRTKKG